jgi:hypothetical protein
MLEKSNWWETDHPDAEAHATFLRKCAEEAVPVRSAPRRRTGANTAGYVTWAELGRQLEAAGKAVAEELRKRDLRIAELESRPVGLDYKGIWKPGMTLHKNAGVTHAGSIWVATRDSPTAEPGTPNSGFRLAVKKGRDAK